MKLLFFLKHDLHVFEHNYVIRSRRLELVSDNTHFKLYTLYSYIINIENIINYMML